MMRTFRKYHRQIAIDNCLAHLKTTGTELREQSPFAELILDENRRDSLRLLPVACSLLPVPYFELML